MDSRLFGQYYRKLTFNWLHSCYQSFSQRQTIQHAVSVDNRTHKTKRDKTSILHNITPSLSLTDANAEKLLNTEAHYSSYRLLNMTLNWASQYVPSLAKNRTQKTLDFDLRQLIAENKVKLKNDYLHQYQAKSIPLAEAHTKAEKNADIESKKINSLIAFLEEKIKKNTDHAIIDELNCQKVQLLRDDIMEHAYRFVEQYFLLLIAVRDTHCVIVKNGGATNQHGKGSSKHKTAGCHSNPLTNLEFIPLTPSAKPPRSLKGTHFGESFEGTMELPETVNQFDKHFEGMYGMSYHVKDCLTLLNRCANPMACDLLVMAAPKKNKQETIADALRNGLRKLPIHMGAAYLRIDDKLFYVNKWKRQCEEILLSPATLTAFDETFTPKKSSSVLTADLLRQVTKITGHEHQEDKLTPIDAMMQFYLIQDKFYQQFSQKYIIQQRAIANPKTMARICEYKKKGTFLSTENQCSARPSDEFIALTLRMTPLQCYTANNSPWLFNPYYQRIQEEIFQSKPLEVKGTTQKISNS